VSTLYEVEHSGDADAELKALEVVKLFAKGASLYQAHDVGKSNPMYKGFVKNDTDDVRLTQTQLLPENFESLWTFLEECNMKKSTKRTIWKHMINCVRWLPNAFPKKLLKSAYDGCGLWPIDFLKFIQRMPAWEGLHRDDETWLYSYNFGKEGAVYLSVCFHLDLIG
jgi:hypothetical protein